MPPDRIHECVLGYRGLAVAVRSEAAAPLHWLREFVLPWFEDEDRGEARVTIELAMDAKRHAALAAGEAPDEIDCFTMDGGFERHALRHDTPSERMIRHAAAELVLAIRPASRVIELTARMDHARMRVALMRVVRELMTMQSLSRGDLPLHAAGAIIEDRAVLFTGAKRAGKTTMLLDALRQSGAQLLSNDRVMVRLTEARAIARGMPTIVSVRPEGLDRLGSLSPPRWPQSHRHYLSMRECAEGSPLLEPAHRSPPGMSPAQFCRGLGVSAAASAPLAAIIFPVIDPAVKGFTLTRVSESAAASCLGSSLLGGPGAAEAFAILSGSPPPKRDAAESCRQLARRSPCYECRLGPRAFESPDLREAVAAAVGGRA